MLQISSDFENMPPELCEAEPATGSAWRGSVLRLGAATPSDITRK